MKKSLIFTSFISSMTITLSAQQLPLFSEYLHNSFTANPAMMGWENITALSASYRQQWTGMRNAPRTAALSYQQFNEQKNMGYGAYFMQDQTGPTSFTTLNLAYAYHIKFKPEAEGLDQRNRLSIGLSLAGTVYRLRGRDLVYNDPDDQLIINANQSKFLPDAGVGITYYNDLYYVGISVPQMISMRVKYHDANAISNLRRVAHFYMTAGVKLPLGGKTKLANGKERPIKHYIIPSFWLKFAPMSPLNITATARYMWEQKFSAGLGIASDGTMQVDFNINIKQQFRLGYAFSVGINGLAQYLGTNHEVMLTYIFTSTGKGWMFPKVDLMSKTPSRVQKEPYDMNF